MQLNLLVIGPERPDPDSIRTNVEGLSDFLEDTAKYPVIRASELPETITHRDILFLINPFAQLPYDEFRKVYGKNLFFYFSDCNEYQDIYRELGKISSAVIVDDPSAVTFFNQFCIKSHYIFHGLADNFVKNNLDEISERDFDYSFFGRVDRGLREQFFQDHFEHKQRNVETGIQHKICTSGKESLALMFDTYKRSKFVINFTGISTKNPLGFGRDTSPKMTKQIKGRVYEALACGANVLTEDHPHIPVIFEDLLQYIKVTSKINSHTLKETVLGHHLPIPIEKLEEIQLRISYKNTADKLVDVMSSVKKHSVEMRIPIIFAMRYRQAWLFTQARRVRTKKLKVFKFGLRDILAFVFITLVNSYRGHG